MKTRQIILPFRRQGTKVQPNANEDLIGCAYDQDEYITVTVIDVCLEDPGRVVVQRDLDGKSWTMPAWLMRLILLADGKRAA